VAVEPERPLTKRLQVGHGAQGAPDQPLDLHGAALLAARAGLALRPLTGRGRKEPVLPRHPSSPGPLEPARHSLDDGRSDERTRAAEGDQSRALRLVQVVDIELQRAKPAPPWGVR